MAYRPPCRTRRRCSSRLRCLQIAPLLVVLLAIGPQTVWAQPAPAQPPPQEQKKDGENKPAEAKPAEPSQPIKRPAEPSSPPKPQELEAKPDAEGKIQFRFQHQKWQDVLEWLAEWSGLTLDWTELPGDYVDITTSRKYTVGEARSTFNRMLLDRGYTLLVFQDVLSVEKLDKLNPGKIPRVAPETLKDRDPYEFVKVSFPLDWLLADNKTVEELKPMLHPTYGKLTPLAATNRVEAMDTAANLHQLYELLKQEQSASGKERLAQLFKLKNTRVEEIHQQLCNLLGIEMRQQTPKTPEQMQMEAQMAMMRMQRQQQGGGPAPPDKPAADVNFAVLVKENALLVHAKPDKMAIVAKAIELMDVKPAAVNLLESVHRFKRYQLGAIDPEVMVTTLREFGNLEHNTQLRVDKQNRALIVFASPTDHFSVHSIIKALDTSDRSFEVIWLRKLPADAVAETIHAMMGVEEKKETTRRPWWYSSMDNQDSGKDHSKQFSVRADVVNNRLLIRANDVELKEIHNLLAKLGEVPAGEHNPSRVRQVDVYSPDDTERLLDQLRRVWPSISPHPLEIDESLQKEAEPPKPQPERRPRPAPTEKDETTASAPPHETLRMRRGESRGETAIQFAQFTAADTDDASRTDTDASEGTESDSGPEQPSQAELEQLFRMLRDPGEPSNSTDRPEPAADSPIAAEPTHKPAPIRITKGPDGQLIITGDDPQALDLLEELIAQSKPRRQEYRTFKLRYAWPSTVVLNLEDFFKETGDDDKQQRRPWWYYDDYGDDNKSKDSGMSIGLGKRRPLKFIWDTDTKSVIVIGGDADQIRTVDELIKFYDQPPPSDSLTVRKQEVLHLRYSKAATVAATVKDVYRDVLSANDKALQDGKQKSPERVYNYSFGDDSGSGDDTATPRFKGLLSLGVDEVSNSLVLSAPKFLFDDIKKLIEQLDEQARPSSTVSVVRLDGAVNADVIRKALASVLGAPTAPADAAKTPQPANPNPATPPAQPANNGDAGN